MSKSKCLNKPIRKPCMFKLANPINKPIKASCSYKPIEASHVCINQPENMWRKIYIIWWDQFVCMMSSIYEKTQVPQSFLKKTTSSLYFQHYLLFQWLWIIPLICRGEDEQRLPYLYLSFFLSFMNCNFLRLWAKMYISQNLLVWDLYLRCEKINKMHNMN